MNDTEAKLRHLLNWIAEHDDDAANAAIDLQILAANGGHGLEAELIYDAIFDEDDDFPTIDPDIARHSATGMLLVHLYSRVELVRAALPAFLEHSTGAEPV